MVSMTLAVVILLGTIVLQCPLLKILFTALTGDEDYAEDFFMVLPVIAGIGLFIVVCITIPKGHHNSQERESHTVCSTTANK